MRTSQLYLILIGGLAMAGVLILTTQPRDTHIEIVKTQSRVELPSNRPLASQRSSEELFVDVRQQMSMPDADVQTSMDIDAKSATFDSDDEYRESRMFDATTAQAYTVASHAKQSEQPGSAQQLIDDQERVVDISISGGRVQVVSDGQLLWQNDQPVGTTLNEAGGESKDDMPSNESGSDTLSSVEQQADSSEPALQCPDSLYMGGNSYAVSMLKRAGCPKPANYQGEW